MISFGLVSFFNSSGFHCQDAAANFRFRFRVWWRRAAAAGLRLSVGPGRAAAMETLYRLPFAVLECPNIKLKRPSWVHMPSAMTVYALVVVSYFLITGGEAGAGRAGGASGRPRLRSSPFSVGRAAGPCPGSRGRC